MCNESDGEEQFAPSSATGMIDAKGKERPQQMGIFCNKVIEEVEMKHHTKSHKYSHEKVAAILKKPIEGQNSWIYIKLKFL
ncbi:hypothetical protein ScPMuIL_010363 [Solemya velum]